MVSDQNEVKIDLDRVCDLLAKSVINGVSGIAEALEAVVFKDENHLVSIMSTLARIKMLEVTILKTAVVDLKLSPEQVQELVNEVHQSALLLITSSGGLDPNDVLKLYPHLNLAEALGRAASFVDRTVSHEDSAEAVRNLSESLEKLGELTNTQ